MNIKEYSEMKEEIRIRDLIKFNLYIKQCYRIF